MLDQFAQTWHGLGYPEIALCVHDFLSPDEELRERAYDILCDIEHPDSGIAYDYRYVAQAHYIEFVMYLFKESVWDRLYLLQLMNQSGGSYFWSQEEKDNFEDLVASYIDYLEQFVDIPEWKYHIFQIFSGLPRYRERLAPILLNSSDEMGITPHYLAQLMMKPLSNLEAYIAYFTKHLSSESVATQTDAQQALARLLADETQ
jgi:hypothetical protein